MARLVDSKFSRKFWIQILFWFSYFLFEWLNTGAWMENFQRSLNVILIHLPVLILAGYWHLFFTVRRFLLKGRMAAFWMSLLGGILVFGLLRRGISYQFIYPLYHPSAMSKPLIYWPKIFYETMQIHLVAALFVLLDLMRHAIQQQHLSEDYRRQKLVAEYNLLQSQVQPHFIFNTLNNLVSVSMHRPAQMPGLLQRLAGLLSYQLHESHQVKIPLSKELDYLNDYIELEKLRYGDRLDVQTNFGDWAGKPDITIPPMLLLTFVENAFKHGAAQIESDCWIQINLSQTGNRLVFTVENSIPENKPEKTTTGLGLTNLKKRLEILFPGNYEMGTFPESGQFLAVLKFTYEYDNSMLHT